MPLPHGTFEVDRLFSLILRLNLCSTTKTSTTISTAPTLSSPGSLSPSSAADVERTWRGSMWVGSSKIGTFSEAVTLDFEDWGQQSLGSQFFMNTWFSDIEVWVT